MKLAYLLNIFSFLVEYHYIVQEGGERVRMLVYEFSFNDTMSPSDKK